MGYTVERRLGSGGFGAVYLARCEGQAYALKLLDLARVGGRVEREVSILLQLSHPNVVGIHGFGKWPVVAPEFGVIIMEYVEGRQLDVWASEENPSARQVARVMLDVARALDGAHGAGVLHRDVKEANVMVRTSDGAAKLVDFGVGDYVGAPGLTVDVLPPGTPEYRSPEAWSFFRKNAQVLGAIYAPGPMDDLWALGVALYQLLTGRPPFGGDNFTLADIIIAQEVMPPRQVNERVPSALSDVCMSLLEKSPAARMPSARALCVALEDALRGADPSWDVPLCDAFGADTATTEGGRDSLDKWLEEPLHRPRRGKKLPQAVPAIGKEQAPPLEEQAPSPPRPQRASRILRGRGAAVLVGLLALVAVVMVWTWGTLRVAGAVPARQEVARSGSSSQAVQAPAPSPGKESTPVAVAAPAMLPEATTVKMEKTETPTPPKPTRKSASIMSRALVAVAACTGLACPGVQVRPPPPPEPCPDGAVAAMKDLDIGIGDRGHAVFSGVGGKVVSVRDGPVRMRLAGDWEDMPGNTVLSGELVVRDRVYGRLTWATPPKGRGFPVCLEVYEDGGGRGMPREGGDDSDSSARIFSSARVKAVSEFE
ncbi:serine/threonine-protein kinase [Myxococcus stipitatus]|nr:serine/threonine-protein kinase [Myxococcus stipitatus]